MSEPCPLNRPPDRATDLVLSVSEEAAASHRELFGLSATAYVTPREHRVDRTVLSGASFLVGQIGHFEQGSLPGAAQVSGLHIVVDWEALIALAFWRGCEPRKEELVRLLTTAGLGAVEAEAAVAAGRRSILEGLCREGRFDILKTLCRLLRRKVQDRTTAIGLSVECHLYAAGTKRIVASSL